MINVTENKQHIWTGFNERHLISKKRKKKFNLISNQITENQENTINYNILPTRLAMCNTAKKAEDMSIFIYYWDYKLVPFLEDKPGPLNSLSFCILYLIQKFIKNPNIPKITENIGQSYLLLRFNRC